MDQEDTGLVRRRRPREENNRPAVSVPVAEIVPYEPDAIEQGFSFKSPSQEFPLWDKILKAVQQGYVRFSSETGNSEIVKEEGYFYDMVNKIVVQDHPEFRVAPIEVDHLIELLRIYMFGYKALEDYMRIDGLEELYFNRFDQGFYIVRGKKHRITDHVFKSEQDLLDFVQHVARENGLEINLKDPNLDATLADGSRLNATLPPIAVDGPDLVIRKHHSENPFTVEKYIQSNMFTREVAEDLEKWIKGGLNIIVSGGTSSGKTSFLNTICNAFLPRDSRVLIVENTKELQIKTDDFKYFQTRVSSSRQSTDDTEINAKDVTTYTLRKTADRLIMGEIRGKEAYYALEGWNTGHDGSFCTMHANSAPQAVKRLEQMCRSAGELESDAIRELIASAVDIVIQVKKYRGREERKVIEIIQVLDPYKFDQYDKDIVERVEQLKSTGDIRVERGNLWILPLYRLDKDRLLTKINDIVPVEGKEIDSE